MHMKPSPTQHPPSAETQRSQAWVPGTAEECQTGSQRWLSPSHPPGPSSSLYRLLGFLRQLGLGWVQVLHRWIHSCSLEGAMHPRRSPDPHIFCLPPSKPRGCSLWVKGAFPHIFAKWRWKEFLRKQVSCETLGSLLLFLSVTNTWQEAASGSKGSFQFTVQGNFHDGSEDMAAGKRGVWRKQGQAGPAASGHRESRKSGLTMEPHSWDGEMAQSLKLRLITKTSLCILLNHGFFLFGHKFWFLSLPLKALQSIYMIDCWEFCMSLSCGLPVVPPSLLTILLNL